MRQDCALHMSGLFWRVASREPYEVMFGFCQKQCRGHSKVEEDALMNRPKLNMFVQNTLCGGKITLHINLNRPTPYLNMVVENHSVGVVLLISDINAGQSWFEDGWREIQGYPGEKPVHSLKIFTENYQKSCFICSTSKQPHRHPTKGCRTLLITHSFMLQAGNTYSI